MIKLIRLPTIIAIVLCGAVGLSGDPAIAKKYSDEKASVQKKTKKKSNAAKDCKKGPVPPFMRNPRFMNRGFLKNRC
ncbi:hypothetical protein AUC70_00200 [Methyloceanibacter stevinii]|uniref:Uncharacterized protein n=1 Tax=Methyloceanibacter stevinii TaxID=1774970 RepID=A0A1E3VVA7_9HYPH|nr:hypothetical protein [Methyloceanibacter stevinii]ODR97488.1 hypothetical protein AUC70_00200 [Methyloceanibacter stevinii]